MTTIDDGSLKADYLLKVLDLPLKVDTVIGPTADVSMDHLIIFIKLVIVLHNHLLNLIGDHQGLQAIPLVLSLNPDDL